MNKKFKKLRNKHPQSTQTRNKQLTKRLLLEATGEILREHGISGLNISRIAQHAGRSTRMIYDYYGTLDGLLSAFLKENDHWLSYEKDLDRFLEIHKADSGFELGPLMLKAQFHRFSEDELLQKIRLMELNQKNNPVLKDISRLREKLGEKIFSLSEQHFRNSGVNYRAIVAILVGGLDFMILHSKASHTTFCGINVENLNDQHEILKCIDQITRWAFDAAEKNKS